MGLSMATMARPFRGKLAQIDGDTRGGARAAMAGEAAHGAESEGLVAEVAGAGRSRRARRLLRSIHVCAIID